MGDQPDLCTVRMWAGEALSGQSSRSGFPTQGSMWATFDFAKRVRVQRQAEFVQPKPKHLDQQRLMLAHTLFGVLVDQLLQFMACAVATLLRYSVRSCSAGCLKESPREAIKRSKGQEVSLAETLSYFDDDTMKGDPQEHTHT